MWGKIPDADRHIYRVVDYCKNNSDKSRKGFLEYLILRGISPNITTINRWLSSIEINHHMPAFVLTHFTNYFKDNGGPSSLAPLTHIAHNAGYRLAPIMHVCYGHSPLNTHDKDGSFSEFFKAVAHNQKESADVISAAAEGMYDGELNKEELLIVQKELLEQMEAVSMLITMVDGELVKR